MAKDCGFRLFGSYMHTNVFGRRLFSFILPKLRHLDLHQTWKRFIRQRLCEVEMFFPNPNSLPPSACVRENDPERRILFSGYCRSDPCSLFYRDHSIIFSKVSKFSPASVFLLQQEMRYLLVIVSDSSRGVTCY